MIHTGYIGLFGHPPELDLVMHVLGGFAIACALHSAIPILRPLLGTAAATLCTLTIHLRRKLLPPADALAES